jgi:hypothetical protein
VKPRDPAFRAAATEYAQQRRAVMDDVLERHDLPRIPRDPEVGIYGPGSGRSWFADSAFARASDEQLRDVLPPPLVGSPQEAQARLERSAARERRDLSTAATTGGGFLPTGPPAFIGSAFAAAARAAAVLPSILPTHPLPDIGMNLTTPRITTGTAAGTTAENAAVQETDLVEALVSGHVGTISAVQDLSQQLADRADPPMIDVILATELGRAMAARLDAQILAGAGTGAELVGLLTVASIGTLSYTDASPTQAEAFPKILQAAAALSVALGRPADTILMSPRRLAWFLDWRDTGGAPAVITWPAEVVVIPGIPITGGANTDEDYVLLLRRDELPLYLGPPQLESFIEPGSGTLTVKCRARQYAASLFGRRPEAIHKVSGTGFGGVTFA